MRNIESFEDKACYMVQILARLPKSLVNDDGGDVDVDGDGDDSLDPSPFHMESVRLFQNLRLMSAMYKKKSTNTRVIYPCILPTHVMVQYDTIRYDTMPPSSPAVPALLQNARRRKLPLALLAIQAPPMP